MINKKVRIEIEVDIEIKDISKFRGGLSEEDFLAEWNESFFDVDSMDDIYIHIAECMANGYSGCNMDGVGRINGQSPDVRAWLTVDHSEIVSGEQAA